MKEPFKVGDIVQGITTGNRYLILNVGTMSSGCLVIEVSHHLNYKVFDYVRIHNMYLIPCKKWPE